MVIIFFWNNFRSTQKLKNVSLINVLNQFHLVIPAWPELGFKFPFHEVICIMKLWKPSSAPGAGWEVSAHSDETSYTGEPDPVTPLHAGSLVGRTWYSPLRRIRFLWCCFQEIQFLKKSWQQRLLVRLNNPGSRIVVSNNVEIREGNPC